MSTQKNYKAIIKRIVDTSQEKLNDWEIEFISSVYDWCVIKDNEPSEKQANIILKINSRLMGRI
jgi:hypothetical protein